jgi:hypothetical protein
MKAKQDSHICLQADSLNKQAHMNLCGFFHLLLKIDKRNNLKIYENQESRNYPYPPS